MASCRQIEPLITPYVDDRASADERVIVAEHLEACDRCRESVSDETAARLILRERSAALREQAPNGLHERCLSQRAAPELERVSSARRVFGPAWLGTLKTRASRVVPRPIPAWAATFAVLAIAVAAIVSAGNNTKVLAAELTLDHLKCFALFERGSSAVQPAAIGERMQAEYGWHITVPDSSPPLKLRLVAGRRCFSTDGRVAHILYRHDGRPLSLFVMPASARTPQQTAVLGHEAIIWSSGGTTYAIVAREPHGDVERIAQYMQDAVGGRR